MRTGNYVSALLFALAAAHALHAAPARLTVERGAVVARGLTLANPVASSSYRVVDGPRADIKGVAATAGPVAIEAALPAALAGRGSLMFWFQTPAAYETGQSVMPFRETLITLPGAMTVQLAVEKSAVTLAVVWEGAREDVFERHIRVILPRLPGPAWHHVAVTWDGAKGESNAFLNGTPYYVIGEPMAPFPIRSADAMVAHVGRFALAEVRVDAEPFTPEQLRAAVGDSHWGTLAGLLGAEELPPIAVEERRGERLYARALATENDVRDWKLEGPGIRTFRDGWMHLRSERPDGPQGHVVYWCPEVFPERFAAEWEFELLEPKGLCIVFFAARGREGKDLFDPSLAPRTGVFTHYTHGDIDAYHISYFANTPAVPRAVANLRKNHGFYILANGPIGVSSGRAGETHRALLVKDGARIQMAVDGRTIIDYTDDGQRAGSVFTDGRIGLRQMQWTNGRYRNFRVYALKPSAP